MPAPNGMEFVFIGDDQGIHQIYVPLIVAIETPSAQLAAGPDGNGA
jgi:hypothetical protein